MGNGLDITIILTAMVAGYLGWRLGLMRTAVSPVGAGVGVVLASHYYSQVAQYVPESIGDPEIADTIGFAAIALAIFIASVVLGSIARRVLHFCLLGWADGLAGLLAGAGLMLVLWTVALGSFGHSMGGDLTQATEESRVAAFLLENSPRVVSLAPEPVTRFVDSNISSLDISKIVPFGN